MELMSRNDSLPPLSVASSWMLPVNHGNSIELHNQRRRSQVGDPADES